MTLLWYLQITRVCNNNCIYCSNPANGRMLDLSEIQGWLLELKNTWYTDVMLTWGEPTIHPKFFEIVGLCHKVWLNPRIITNGLTLSDEQFVKKLKSSWISIVHLSIYSYKKDLNDKLRRCPWAFDNLLKGIVYLRKYWINTQTTIVISSYNQDHLYKTTYFFKNLFPELNHFVWNVLDPKMMIIDENSIDSMPDLNLLKDELQKTFKYLESKWSTFRIERIPLCLIPWYEWSNTEARKLVKKESRKVIFLDDREIVDQSWSHFRHEYRDECSKCVLKDICSWVYMLKKYFSNFVANPISDTKILKSIEQKILWDNN